MRLSSISPRKDSAVAAKATPSKAVSIEQIKTKLSGRSTPLPSRASIVNPSAPPPAIAVPANNASFRVYSPAEVAALPMRPGYRPAPSKSLGEEVKASCAALRSASAMKIVTWALSAMFAMVLFFVFILVVANASDDTLTVKADRQLAKSPPTSAKSIAEAASSLPPPPAPPSVAAPAATTDFELPGDATPPQRTAVVGKAKSPLAPKQGRRSVTIRNAPF